MGCWTAGPKSPLGEVENLLTCAGISIETGRLVTGWVMGSRLVVYFFLGLTFETSANYRTYAYRIGSMTQPKPLYWPKWDPWKLQRNIMNKIVLIRGLVVAIWFIAEKSWFALSAHVFSLILLLLWVDLIRTRIVAYNILVPSLIWLILL